MAKGKRGHNLRNGQPRPWILKGEKHPQWKGEMATSGGKRKRARRRYKLGPCDDCGKPATDRHHSDGDTGNNEPGNIAILCRRCHMLRDGRLADLVLAASKVNKRRRIIPSPCVNCGALAKPLRKGLCHACNEFLRRTGKMRPYKTVSYRDTVAEKHAGPCLRCGRPSGIKGYPTKGFCASCYAYVLNRAIDGKPVKAFSQRRAKKSAKRRTKA
jgi:hypothetical protein